MFDELSDIGISKRNKHLNIQLRLIIHGYQLTNIGLVLSKFSKTKIVINKQTNDIAIKISGSLNSQRLRVFVNKTHTFTQ